MFRKHFTEMIYSKVIPKVTKKFIKKMNNLDCVQFTCAEESFIILRTDPDYIIQIEAMHNEHLKKIKNGTTP